MRLLHSTATSRVGEKGCIFNHLCWDFTRSEDTSSVGVHRKFFTWLRAPPVILNSFSGGAPVANSSGETWNFCLIPHTLIHPTRESKIHRAGFAEQQWWLSCQFLSRWGFGSGDDQSYFKFNYQLENVTWNNLIFNPSQWEVFKQWLRLNLVESCHGNWLRYGIHIPTDHFTF